jgi:hypothetical protein
MTKSLLIFLLGLGGCAGHAPASRPAPPSTIRPPATALRFADLVEPGPAGPAPSRQAKALAGQRVRLVGYMAHLEEGPTDGFYLSPTPVHGDEMGGGTGDLPLVAVRVHLRPVPRALPEVEGRVAVKGRLDLGPKEDADGRLSHLRLFVDAPLSPTAKP